MAYKSLYLIFIILLFSQNLLWAQHIIPQPVSVQMANGFLGFDSNLPVILDENDQEQMRLKTHVTDVYKSLIVSSVLNFK
jgi:hypothetical protein